MFNIFQTWIDLTKNEIRNPVFHKLITEPAVPVEGQFYYNTTTKLYGYYNGTAWVYGTSGAELLANKAVNFTTVNDTLYPSVQAVVTEMNTRDTANRDRANHTGTQLAATISNFATTVLATLLTGLSLATATAVTATDSILIAVGKLQAQITAYAASTKTLTNTTIDANGTGNVISNIEVADLAAGVLNTSGTLAGATATQIPSALATQQAIANAVTGVAKPMGGIDCSLNPNYPAANAGEFYRVTVAGKIGGAAGINVTVGDVVHCYVTGIAGTQATVGSNWTIVQSNVEQATTTTLGLVALTDATAAEAKADTLKAVTASSLANFPIKRSFTFGDGIATSFTITHNLNTQDITASARLTATNEFFGCNVIATTVNTVTVSGFATPPAAGAMKVVIVG